MKTKEDPFSFIESQLPRDILLMLENKYNNRAGHIYGDILSLDNGKYRFILRARNGLMFLQHLGTKKIIIKNERDLEKKVIKSAKTGQEIKQLFCKALDNLRQRIIYQERKEFKIMVERREEEKRFRILDSNGVWHWNLKPRKKIRQIYRGINDN